MQLKTLFPFLYFFFLYSCQQKDTKVNDNLFSSRYSLDLCLNSTFNFRDFEITILNNDQRPYSERDEKFKLPKIYDKDSVILINYNEKNHYHPVAMANTSITMLEVFLNYDDSTALRIADKHANKLLEISKEYENSLLFPYYFRYLFNEKDELEAPWVSAMAQGKALSLFSRLYVITQKSKYLKAANKTFNSFSLMKYKHPIWVTCIDRNENLWFEEYPNIFPSHVLNGKIFSLYGIYDYYCLTKDKKAKKYLLGGITTIKKFAKKYRNKNAHSYYCLKYDVTNDNYHRIHIRQLKKLYQITKDEFFNKLSQSFGYDV